MKKITLSILVLFICATSLYAQITREQADEIVFQYIQTEIASPYLLYGYAPEPSEEGMIINTLQQEIIEVEYACWAYYINEFPNQSVPCQHRYLFVKEDDGNLLEVITAYDLGVTDFTDWVLSVIHNATLSALSVSEGELEPAFSSEVFNYEVNVTDAEAITIAAIPTHANATVSGAGTFELEGGENVFTIQVVAEDGITELDYSIVINNIISLSQDATLSTLSISAGELEPAFSSEVFNYEVNVTDAEEITITAIPTHANATVNGAGTFPLEVGENCFTIQVIAEDETTELNYTIVVNNLLDIKETEISSVKIYPNPTTGELKISPAGGGLRGWNNGELRIEDIEVFDVYGRKQKAESRKQKAEGIMEIDISQLPAGVYFIKITTETGITTRKIIKN